MTKPEWASPEFVKLVLLGARNGWAAWSEDSELAQAVWTLHHPSRGLAEIRAEARERFTKAKAACADHKAKAASAQAVDNVVLAFILPIALAPWALLAYAYFVCQL